MQAPRILIALGACALGTLAACGQDGAVAGSHGAAAAEGAGPGTSVSGASGSASSSSGGVPLEWDGGVVPADTLNFAIVGDTRPVMEDDLGGYPTPIITKIWQDVEAHGPHPAFAIATGDYVYANPMNDGAGKQLDIYLAARAAFSNHVFPALGNHECTGATTSDCGEFGKDGITKSYTAFLDKMLAPLGQTNPYYEVHVAPASNAWTAKFIVLAANAWSIAQANFLEQAMTEPTTYTFIVRHEGTTADTAPGVTPSAMIMAKHPYTLLIAGHTHSFEYHSNEREVIVGNGGAPLSSNMNYGYTIANRRDDGAIVITAYDYETNEALKSYAMKADGSPTQ